MRPVEISGGNSIEIRPLKRKEIQQLSRYNIGYMRCDLYKLAPEEQDAGIDAVLATQFKVEELEGISNPDNLKLFNEIIAETYSSEDEEKNLSRSGPSDQTLGEESTADNA